jgi:peptidoglycan/xylan/chitin deacetylase (PgdA/CDA1 family)
MLRQIRRAILHVQRSSGVFRLVAESNWRRERLLILCYHGISRQDEHLWRPDLYMHPDVFRQRMEILKQGGYHVLPLGESLQLLQAGDLPSKSVAITFDDGGYDFYAEAFPIIKSYGFPVTVYQTTYYGDHPVPIFNLAWSYLLWQRRGSVLTGGKAFGFEGSLDLRTEDSRAQIVRKLVLNAEAAHLTGVQKDDLALQLAKFLSIPYEEIVASRIFQVMTPSERSQLAAEGVDFQLHTHRHRTPIDENLFCKEIQDNRRGLRELGEKAVHFCYPSGVYRPEFSEWLKKERVVSATTCDAGLADQSSNPFLLPRLVDTSARTKLEFEAWLSGVALLLTFRRAATQIIPAAAGRASQIDDRSKSVLASGSRED